MKMMNKKMKKMLAMGLVVLVMSAPVLSFANEAAPGIQRESAAEGRLAGRLDAFKDGLRERAGQAQERKDLYRRKLTGLINEYAPGLLDEFQDFWEDHDALHEQLMEEKQGIAEEKKEAATAFFEMIGEQVASGEMTREEAKEEIEAYGIAAKAERDAVKSEIEALKESMGVDQEVVKALHESLKAAAEAGDANAIGEILEEMIRYHPQHLSFDQGKLELLMSK